MAQKVASLEAEITAETGDFERGLSNVEKAIKGTRTTIGGLDKDIKAFGTNLGSTNDALHAMGVNIPITPMAALGQGLKIVGDTMKAAINETVDYAKQVRDLGRAIGATAEETSMLIQAADDVQVSVGSLTAGLNAAIRKGISPTIEGIGQLADQYNAIQDPIARTKFLMDNFGRSGADLAPLMEQGADGIAELGLAAKRTGLVLSGESVQAARDYEIALDDATDAAMGFKIAFAQGVLPALTQGINVFTEARTVQQRYNEALKSGALTQQDINEIRLTDMVGLRELGLKILEAAEAREAEADAIRSTARAYDYMIPKADDAADAARQITGAFAGQIDVAIAGEKANTKYAISLGKIADQQADMNTAISAGISGSLGNAQEEYLSVIKETTPEIDKLTEQIAKYQRQQGMSITVTGEATTTANEYELATIKAAVAAQKLAENNGENRQEWLELSEASDRAAASVVKLGEGFGFTEQYTLDYTKRIAEANGSLAELEAAQAGAEAALRRTTAEFVLQATAGALTGQALLNFSRATGILSEADYELATRTLTLIDLYDKNNDGVVTLEEGSLELADTLAFLADRTADTTVAIADGTKALELSDGAMAAAREEADLLAIAANGITTALNNIPKTIDININMKQNYTKYGDEDFGGWSPPAGTGTGTSGGSTAPPAPGDDFVPPPGMNGQTRNTSNGTTINQYINTTAPISETSLLQTAKAVAGSWSR